MAEIDHFDPRTRLCKLTNARNILLLVGLFLVSFNTWVLVTLPMMIGREPEMPQFVVREEILKLAGLEKETNPDKAITTLKEKDAKAFEKFEADAKAKISGERKALEATLLEKSPPVSWAGIGAGVFTLFAALLLPWMPGALAVISAFVFLATCGVEIYQFGASGLLNGIIIKIICMVLYFYAGRLSLEAETGHRVK